MMEQSDCLYDFESFRIDTLKRQLLRDGDVLPLTSKAFKTLLMLVRRQGETVTKDELMKTIWFDTVVEENNLTQQISTLRRTLGEHAGEHRYIVTIPGQGYCFIAPVKENFYGETGFVLQEITQSSITIDICGNETPQMLPAENRSAPFLYFQKPQWLFAGLLLVIIVCGVVLFYGKPAGFRSTAPLSIAVLPFKSLDNEKDNTFNAGITDTLTAKIGNLKSLTVRPVNSSSEYIGQEQNAVTIGRELRVDAVLAGSIQHDGDRIRVTIQVLDVENNRVLWGQSFNKDATDSFTVQDIISEEIVSALQVKFSS